MSPDIVRKPRHQSLWLRLNNWEYDHNPLRKLARFCGLVLGTFGEANQRYPQTMRLFYVALLGYVGFIGMVLLTAWVASIFLPYHYAFWQWCLLSLLAWIVIYLFIKKKG